MAKSEEKLDELLTMLVGAATAYVRDFKTEDGQSIDRYIAKIKAHTATVAAEAAREAERRGELHQLKMLKHWAKLHRLTITVDDLDHVITSLERVPDQPLARETLAALNNTQAEEKQSE